MKSKWAWRYEGKIIQSDHIILVKRALGVTTGILPWNFPFFLITHKMSPALVTGKHGLHEYLQTQVVYLQS